MKSQSVHTKRGQYTSAVQGKQKCVSTTSDNRRSAPPVWGALSEVAFLHLSSSRFAARAHRLDWEALCLKLHRSDSDQKTPACRLVAGFGLASCAQKPPLRSHAKALKMRQKPKRVFYRTQSDRPLHEYIYAALLCMSQATSSIQRLKKY